MGTERKETEKEMITEELAQVARILVRAGLYNRDFTGTEMTVFEVQLLPEDGVGYVGKVYVVVVSTGYVCPTCDVTDTTPVMMENPLA